MELNDTTSGAPPRITKFLRPVDVATLAYMAFAAFAAVTLIGRIPSALSMLALHGGGTIALLAFLRYSHDRGGKVMKFIRSFYPLFLWGWLFHATVELHGFLLFPGALDPFLADADHFIWGFQPSIELHRRLGSPLMDEIICFGYFFYYLIFPVLALKLYFRRRKREFSFFIFVVSFAFYCHYVIFILFPSGGPPYFPNPEHGIPGDGALAGFDGWFFYRVLAFILHTSDAGTGAFPSSHVAVSLAAMIIAFRFERKLFWIMLAPEMLLVFGTVYLHEHYFIDAAGGIISGLIFYWLGAKLKPALDRRLDFPQNY